MITATGKQRYHPYVKTREVETMRRVAQRWGVNSSVSGAQAVRYWLARLYAKGNWELMTRYHAETYQQGTGEKIYLDLSLIEIHTVQWIVKAIQARGPEYRTFHEGSLIGVAFREFAASLNLDEAEKPAPAPAEVADYIKIGFPARSLLEEGILQVAEASRLQKLIPWTHRSGDNVLSCERCGSSLDLGRDYPEEAALVLEIGFRTAHGEHCREPRQEKTA